MRTQELVICKTESRLPSEIKSVINLILDFPDSRSVRYKCLSHTVYAIFLTVQYIHGRYIGSCFTYLGKIAGLEITWKTLTMQSLSQHRDSQQQEQTNKTTYHEKREIFISKVTLYQIQIPSFLHMHACIHACTHTPSQEIKESVVY